MKGSNFPPALALAPALAQIFKLVNQKFWPSKVARASPPWYRSEFTHPRGFQNRLYTQNLGRGKGKGKGRGEVTTPHLA